MQKQKINLAEHKKIAKKKYNLNLRFSSDSQTFEASLVFAVCFALLKLRSISTITFGTNSPCQFLILGIPQFKDFFKKKKLFDIRSIALVERTKLRTTSRIRYFAQRQHECLTTQSETITDAAKISELIVWT